MTAVVLFTRDLRVHDHPALCAAAEEHDLVVPLFVLDRAIVSSPYNQPNRSRFLVESLGDLDTALGRLGAGLVVRRGDVTEEVVRLARAVGASTVYASADVSGYAQQRQRRLADALVADGRALRLCPGITVLPPGAATPAGRDHAAVFSPYYRKWADVPKRPVLEPPRQLRLPDGIDRGGVPEYDELGRGEPAPDLAPGGEVAGRRLLDQWLEDDVSQYVDGQDEMSGDATSRLSPYLHFGCLSPSEIVNRSDRRRSGVEQFVRQLAWRDFHHQVLAARPRASMEDYRSQGDRWETDPEALAAWREGRTGYPIVDAGMRQLLREGWMHNRARLITASFLTKDLYLDWRDGARHFLNHLVDGDIANNQMNWQWVAGTGTDSRPNRVFSPLRQAERYDPEGTYVRRYLPELADIAGPKVHTPWKLPDEDRRRLDYPPPLVDHAQAVRRFMHARGKD